MMAIPTVALMAATLAQTKWLAPTIDPDAYARAAWDLYEAVCKRCAE